MRCRCLAIKVQFFESLVHNFEFQFQNSDTKRLTSENFQINIIHGRIQFDSPDEPHT